MSVQVPLLAHYDSMVLDENISDYNKIPRENSENRNSIEKHRSDDKFDNNTNSYESINSNPSEKTLVENQQADYKFNKINSSTDNANSYKPINTKPPGKTLVKKKFITSNPAAVDNKVINKLYNHYSKNTFAINKDGLIRSIDICISHVIEMIVNNIKFLMITSTDNHKYILFERFNSNYYEFKENAMVAVNLNVLSPIIPIEDKYQLYPDMFTAIAHINLFKLHKNQSALAVFSKLVTNTNNRGNATERPPVTRTFMRQLNRECMKFQKEFNKLNKNYNKLLKASTQTQENTTNNQKITNSSNQTQQTAVKLDGEEHNEVNI